MSLRALLIGINQYAPESMVPSLAGCLNDVHTVDHFLQSCYAADTSVRILLNGEATRANVIAAFREHLSVAGPEDTILIYYSGHGSSGITAPEFQKSVPDKKEESWVLYDSRIPGGYDLADKEIALLLKTTAQHNPDIVVISDSCNSGSITRSAEDFMGWRTRFIPGSSEPRPLGTYLDGDYSKIMAREGYVKPPLTRQIVLSACDKKESALESDQHNGVFTSALMEVLNQTGGQISYSDLFTQACAAIRIITLQQTPQAEALQGFNPRSGFLGASLPEEKRRRYPVHFDPNAQAWSIKFGADSGVSTDMKETIRIELFDKPSGAGAVGEAELNHLGPTDSFLAPGDLVLNKYATYWGEPLALPMVPLPVFCIDPSGSEILNVLKNRPESSIILSAQSAGCPVELRIEQNNFSVYASGSGALIHGIEGTNEESAIQIVEALEQIAHWYRMENLQNPGSRMPEESIQWTLSLKNGSIWEKLDDENVTLSFNETPIPFRLDIRNHSGSPLYIALVYMNPRFGISTLWNDTTPVASGNDPICIFEDVFNLPDGIDRETDTLKLIVSTDRIDKTAFSQPDLEPVVVRYKSIGGTRSVGNGLKYHDWLTRTLRITLLRNRPEGSVGLQPLVLAAGQVTIEPHPEFRSHYSLVKPSGATRGFESDLANHPFFLDNPNFKPLPLSSTRDMDAPYLDLTDILGTGNLQERPLEISLSPSDPDRIILPFCFDGQNFIPAGETVVGGDGKLKILIHNIPDEPSAVQTRNIGRALRLFCFQFAKNEGLPVNTQFLRWIDYQTDGTFIYRDNDLQTRVEAAQKVILLIHGIIGDTKSMVPVFRPEKDQKDTLVLAFDYENLKTPIESTALELKKRLEKIGIGPRDQKQFVIVAHSMGGLVARSLIETYKGSEFVDRLIMTGTPNAGSKFGSIPDYLNWVTVAIGLGMKYFAWSLPALAGILSALKFTKDELLNTLSEMKTGSDYLNRLFAGQNTLVPYHIIAADIQAFMKQENDPDFLDKVLAQSGHWIYQDEANDGVVSVESIFAVEQAVKEIVPGHHCSYFTGAVRFEIPASE